MSKELGELIAIEEILNPQSFERHFFRKGTEIEISEKNITVLTAPPILLMEVYGEPTMVEKNKIPEEANAYLMGNKKLTVLGLSTEIRPASYCVVKR